MSDAATELTKAEQNEIDSAAEIAEQTGDPAGDVRRWLLETHHGTLCTLSVKRDLEGYPFGSVVPFAIDAQGRPFILIADIAAHTANLRKNPRGTLFIHDPHASGDPQSSWRVSVMGQFNRTLPKGSDSRHLETANVIDDAEYADLHARYVERVPAAESYVKQHNFDYWRMEEVHKARYIAGFGRICWIQGEKILRDPLGGGLDEASAPAIEHMNEDHANNMIEMCTGLYGFTPDSAEMIALDASGFQIQTTNPQRHLFFGFGKEIDAEALRVAVIDVLRRARNQTEKVRAE